tara:strand:- start:682 stop:858 length:177 start_codon:yes stop_codon:yes gene_type:complete
MTYYSKDKKEETPNCFLYDTLKEVIIARENIQDDNSIYSIRKHLKSGKFYIMSLGGVN